MSIDLKKRLIEVKHIEHGYDFISLYFSNLLEANEFAARLYARMKRINFKYLDLQRKDLRHLPGDVEHFHTNGDPSEMYPNEFKHFHVLYPKRPTKKDWEDLYQMANNESANIKLSRDLEINKVS